MSPIRILPLTLLAAASVFAQGVDPVAPEQLFERLAPSVWTVETFDAKNRPEGWNTWLTLAIPFGSSGN